MTKYDYLVVGAGFAGSVCAQQLAEAGQRVLLIDKRPHVGGNAYDQKDGHGVLVHPYGPHIFHTNSKRVFEYLSQFTNWRFYEHRVLAMVDGRTYPLPINRTTLNELYGLELDDAGAKAYFARVREQRDPIQSSEDVVLSNIGRDLCEKFFRGYTRKQWGLDLSDLSASVAARVPARTSDDDRYFTDDFQFMPADGYAAMFNRMLGNENIAISVSTSLADVCESVQWRHMIYTGPIDEFFGWRLGRLPYRSLRFEHEHLAGCERFQSVGTVNYPNDHDYTRITEFKHLTGERCAGTSIVREYPQAEGEPYYPIPCEASVQLFRKYRELADATPRVTFVGRLAEYRYYNMDQVVGAALKIAQSLLQQGSHPQP